MKKFEAVLVIAIVIGIIGNFLGINSSNTLFMLSCTILAGLYFYLNFALLNDIPLRKIFKKISYQEISKGRITGSIGMGVAFSIIIIGFQFKFLILPGSHEMLIIGSTFLAFIALITIAIFLFKYKGDSPFYLNCLKRIIPILLIGLLAYWFPTDKLIDIRHRDHPTYAELLKQSLKEPNNEQLRKELAEERDRVFKEN